MAFSDKQNNTICVFANPRAREQKELSKAWPFSLNPHFHSYNAFLSITEGHTMFMKLFSLLCWKPEVNITHKNSDKKLISVTHRRRTSMAGMFSQSQWSAPEPTGPAGASWQTWWARMQHGKAVKNEKNSI